MDDKRKWAFSCFKKLYEQLENSTKYSLAKIEVEYLINRDALWDSLQPISADIRSTLGFASISCGSLI